MKYLAVDLGLKRTGLAVGDDVTGIVSPIEVLTIAFRPQLVAAILDAAREHGAREFVIGLPLNMDDSEGPAAKAARDFAAELEYAGGLPAHLHDERLSSFDAEQSLHQSGRTRQQKKELRDALAAAAILRDFLATRRRDRAGANEADEPPL